MRLLHLDDAFARSCLFLLCLLQVLVMLSRWADRSGLFGVLAPRKKDSKKRNNAAAAGDSNDDNASCNDDEPPKPPIPSGSKDPDKIVTESTEETTDSKQSQVESQQDVVKKRRLDYQQKMEAEAEARGAYCKKQRVKYHNKIQDRWDDAVIVGVHFDDGPDHPYYTIRYKKEQPNEDGTDEMEVSWVEIEKQTTPDRLQRVPFDADASWELLK